MLGQAISSLLDQVKSSSRKLTDNFGSGKRCEELYPEKLERVLIALHCYPEHGC
ncbi:predicted protein [Botrytis cinerea T4]|uniref:Uncharacterized protein n=1 Tax=Botryotinia fuckeliana (strain T4) TaxID=999810 RepID=G2Y4Y2_BOTF4|nr:predicted protein [Botrytis cinerea T4]